MMVEPLVDRSAGHGSGPPARDGRSWAPLLTGLARRTFDPTALRSLFPVNPNPRRLSAVPVLGSAAAVVVGMIAIILRQPGPGALHTIWAEDGLLFLQDALHLPVTSTLARPYRGYVQLFERLIAPVAAHLPLRYAAAIITLASAATVSACAVVVFFASSAHLRSRLARVVLATSIVLLPIGGWETLNNSANVGWYLAIAAFWCLVWRPTHGIGLVAGCVLCFLAVATDAVALALAPLALLRVVAIRDWRDHVITMGFGFGCAFQLWGIRSAGTLESTTRPHGGDLVSVFVARVLAPIVGGDSILRSLWREHGWLAIVAAGSLGGVLIVIGVIRVIRGRPRTSWLSVTLVLMALEFFLVPMVLRWHPDFVPVAGDPKALLVGPRYFVLPVTFGLAVVIVGWIDGWRSSLPSRVAAMVVCAVIATTWVVDFSAKNDRRFGPAWEPALRVAAQSCRRDPSLVDVAVPTAPNIGWHVDVPCRRLR